MRETVEEDMTPLILNWKLFYGPGDGNQTFGNDSIQTGSYFNSLSLNWETIVFDYFQGFIHC